jgi:hypothetical protein
MRRLGISLRGAGGIQHHRTKQDQTRQHIVHNHPKSNGACVAGWRTQGKSTCSPSSSTSRDIRLH